MISLDDIMDEQARRHLLPFVLRTFPGYEAGWFAREVCEALDWFISEVAAKRSPRLILEAPPRHGKSELVSRRFPAFAYGKYPDLSIIAASYGSDLASRMNRDVQRVIDSADYARLFPGTRLFGKNIRTLADGSYMRNSDIFEIVGHKGVYRCAGIGGGITGMGADCLLIDDPIKDAEQADSVVYRNKVWEWFTSTAYTRLAPGGGVLVIMTRWHEDDLVGRLLTHESDGEGEHWRVIRFPAVAEADEPHRREGEPLHPERYNTEHLDRIRHAVGERVWNSLYQQRPSAREGSIFKAENWRYLKPPKPLTIMSAQERKEYFAALGIRKIIQRWDTAIGAKKKNDNDFNACTTLGIAPSRYYLIDVFQDRIEFPELKRVVQQKYDQWLPNAIIVEGGGSASGLALVQELNRETRLPIREVPTGKDKVQRAELVSPNHESGLCYLFEGEPWVSRFVGNCTAFPNVAHDDDVDSFIGALEEAVGGSKGLNISSELLARL
ncbi:MAG: phage terminase large subunit [Bryobacteraceae bacterium]